MIKLFRNIRKKLLQEGPPAARLNDEVGQGRAGKTAGYLKYAIGEIVPVHGYCCPVRDNIRVATTNTQPQPVPLGTEYGMLYLKAQKTV
jgi:hypothetical protein